MLFLFAAISMGFLGSFHCIGMCGPIALALPLVNRSFAGKTFSVLLYNLGRLFTYSALGLLFGSAGKELAIFGAQQTISVLLGAIILSSVLLPKNILNRFSLSRWTFNLFYKLKSSLAALFNRKTFFSVFGIGLLNGLLPCGLVYMAIAGAVTADSALKGAAFMSVFGLGTLPVMFSISRFSGLITVKFRTGINKVLPYFISIMAVMMIVRGLNLGIPYLSPEFKKQTNSVNCCEVKEECKNTAIPSNCCYKK